MIIHSLTRCLPALIFMLAWSGAVVCWAQKDSEKPLNQLDVTSLKHSKAIAQVQQLLQAKNYKQLHVALEAMRSQSKEFHAQLIILLLQEISNRSELEAFDTNAEEEYAFNFFGAPPEVFEKFQIRVPGVPACHNTCQDIRLSGGRAAWALERLLYLYLPPLISGMNEIEFAKATKGVLAEVLYLLATQPNPVPLLNQMTADEKVVLAGSEQTHPRMLVELSKNESVLVRRKVAENYSLPSVIADHLSKNDPDETVRHKAYLITNRDLQSDTVRDWVYGSRLRESLKEIQRRQVLEKKPESKTK